MSLILITFERNFGFGNCSIINFVFVDHEKHSFNFYIKRSTNFKTEIIICQQFYHMRTKYEEIHVLLLGCLLCSYGSHVSILNFI